MPAKPSPEPVTIPYPYTGTIAAAYVFGLPPEPPPRRGDKTIRVVHSLRDALLPAKGN